MTEKKKTNARPTDDDPTRGHDPAALEDAKEKMHITDRSNAKRDADPPGGHDPTALEDAAKKMGVER